MGNNCVAFPCFHDELSQVWSKLKPMDEDKVDSLLEKIKELAEARSEKIYHIYDKYGNRVQKFDDLATFAQPNDHKWLWK